MTLAGSLEALSVASDSLAEAFCSARVTICEDQPHGASTLAVDDLAEALIELDGEATALRDHIRRSVLGPIAPTRAQATELISLAQRALNDISDAVASRVSSSERRAELGRAVRRGGAGWTGWWAAASRGLAQCEQPLRDLRDALFACWRELAEDAAPPERRGRARRSQAIVEPGAPAACSVSAHGDLSGRVVFSTLVEDHAGGPQK